MRKTIPEGLNLIETAPHDGTFIRLYVEGGRQIVGAWREIMGFPHGGVWVDKKGEYIVAVLDSSRIVVVKKFFCLGCNGLDEALFGNPLSQLTGYLNVRTPRGVHFNVVGGADPRPYINQFIQTLAAAHNAGYVIIILGHSLGAMMMFYLADAMKKLGISMPLVISIDSTDWGTNAPGTTPYELSPPTPGEYFVPDNVDHWMHFRQPVYPGGGVAQLAPGNTHTNFENFERVEAHVVLPIIPDIQQKILDAVLKATGA